ncbi:MAG: hypothetical protein ABOK23_09755 [Candidatus Methanoperedens sp.]|nr:hypothetical protein [Candidatus Methanoperedens sp.]
MEPKNCIVNAEILAIVGGIISIISVFLPWFSATSATSNLSVSGLFSISGSGMLLGLIGKNTNWEFQGIGVLALGIASLAISLVLRGKLQSLALIACGILIIGGGAVNLWSLRDVSLFSGSILGETIQSSIGYGLYAVVIGGMAAATGGMLALKDINK